MFYDLNVQWSPNDPQLPRTLAFLHELGYNVVALNQMMTGKLPVDLSQSCAIPDPLPFKDIPSNLTVLRRVTLVLTESHQNARLTALAKEYDLLAVRPIDERTLQLACSSLECDIISLDLTERLPYFFKFKPLAEALKAGKRVEICYSQSLLADAQARRNLISNATQLIRASRGRGLLLCSEAKNGPVGCRGPWDVINLATIWGLSQERGHEGMTTEARNTVVTARLKRTGWRGVVDVVYRGEKPKSESTAVQSKQNEAAQNRGKGKQRPQNDAKEQNGQNNSQKRKADTLSDVGDVKTVTQHVGNPSKHAKQG